MSSPKYVGIRTFLGVPQSATSEVLSGQIVFCGAPLDAGQTYRVGARHGPSAIREASRVIRPYNPRLDLDLAALAVSDAGDAEVVPGSIERGFEAIRSHIGPIVQRAAYPIIMGGDCSIAFPVLGELYSKWGPIALVHFDAHTDTWDEYWGERYTHGTAVRRAIESGYIEPSASVQVGIRGSGYGPSDVEQSRDLGLLVLTADQVHADGASETARRIVERVGSHPVLVHFDIDCLDPAHAPGTGMPEVGGLTTHDASVILVGLAGIKVVAGEVTEVLPAYDPSGITAIAAANVLFELASLAGSHD